jgi:hypothetical protein
MAAMRTIGRCRPLRRELAGKLLLDFALASTAAGAQATKIDVTSPPLSGASASGGRIAHGLIIHS